MDFAQTCQNLIEVILQYLEAKYNLKIVLEFIYGGTSDISRYKIKVTSLCDNISESIYSHSIEILLLQTTLSIQYFCVKSYKNSTSRIFAQNWTPNKTEV